MLMTVRSTLDKEYTKVKDYWVALSEVMSDPVRLAAKFNATVPGACRPVSADDIRYMSHCGLIGRYGFYTREDLETVRGILRYEQLRVHETEMNRGLELVS